MTTETNQLTLADNCEALGHCMLQAAKHQREVRNATFTVGEQTYKVVRHKLGTYFAFKQPLQRHECRLMNADFETSFYINNYLDRYHKKWSNHHVNSSQLKSFVACQQCNPHASFRERRNL